MVVVDDPKTLWTAEEDLRLLDSIGTYGLGNWADIAEAMYGNVTGVASSFNANRYAKQCMERYLDDFLGKYGQIVPPHTLVQIKQEQHNEHYHNMNNNPSTTNTTTNTTNTSDNYHRTTIKDETNHNTNNSKETSNLTNARKRKRGRSSSPFSQNLSSSTTTVSSKVGISIKPTKQKKYKYKAVSTSSLSGFKHIWPYPYLPPIAKKIKVGDDVARDLAARAEHTFVKLTNAATNKEDADQIR